MNIALRPYAPVGIALVGAGIVLAGPVAPPSQHIQVRLMAGDTVGLVIGGSGTPIPGTGYVNAADVLYIHSNAPDTTYDRLRVFGFYTNLRGILQLASWESLALDIEGLVE